MLDSKDMIEYKGQMETLPLIVATGTGPSLLGHDW